MTHLVIAAFEDKKENHTLQNTGDLLELKKEHSSPNSDFSFWPPE